MKAISIIKSTLLLSFLFLSIAVSAQRNPVTWEGDAEKINETTYKLNISASIQSGWYVYAQELESDMGPVPTSLEFDGVETIGETSESGNRKEGMDKAFAMNVVKYLDNVTFSQEVKVPAGATEVKCIVNFMTCNGELCLPPKSIEVLVVL